MRLALEARQDSARSFGALHRVGEQRSINAKTLRGWVERAEIDTGRSPGTTSMKAQRIRELEAENPELRGE